ncbi:hypothetical protein Tco_0003899 [Tanacetum coccineum]
MANIRTCNKHNMIACVEKTEHNADFHQIIDFLAGCSINYSLLVDPDLIGLWLQQFWATASLRVINDVPHIRAMVAGKRILISEETIRADLLLDDANGIDCFPRQVIWDSLRDIGYEGNLAQLTFSKPLFSPQWKYLVHVLLHCLSPKSTSWEQFGTNIASALVGLATNQSSNFSLMLMNGMLGHISNGTPFLMYPRFIQLFLNKQLEGVTRPKNFLPPVTPSPHKAEKAHSESTYSRAETSPRDAQGTDEAQGTDAAQGATDIPKSPNDYTPTNAYQTSGGDEGLLDLYALNREGSSIVKHHFHEDYTADLFFEDIVDKDATVTPDLERKSDETEEINIEEKEASDVKSGDTEELDLEKIQSTTRQSTVTPRPKIYDDSVPSSPIRQTQDIEPEEQFKVDEALADISLNISRPRGLSIPGPIQSQPQQPTQATDLKDKGKGILVEEPKKKKLTLQQIRALETTNDDEGARKIQSEWDSEIRKKKVEELKKANPKPI